MKLLLKRVELHKADCLFQWHVHGSLGLLRLHYEGATRDDPNNRSLLSHSSESQKFNIQELAGVAPGRARREKLAHPSLLASVGLLAVFGIFGLGIHPLHLDHHVVWYSAWMHVCLRIQGSPFYKTQVRLDENLDYLSDFLGKPGQWLAWSTVH